MFPGPEHRTILRLALAALIASVPVQLCLAQFKVTDGNLGRTVLEEYPEFASAELPDIRRIQILRQFAWSHTPSGGRSNQLLQDAAWHAKSAEEQFEILQTTEQGVMCGSTGSFHRKLLNHFGYDHAWSFSSGDTKAGYTHTQTLVRVADGRHIVSDAWLGFTFVDRQSREPLDYFDFLSRLRRQEHASIEVAADDYTRIPTKSRLNFNPVDLDGRTMEQFLQDCPAIIETDYTVEPLSAGRLRFTSQRTLGKFLDQCFTEKPRQRLNYRPWVVAQGHPPNLLYLFVHPIAFNGPDQAAILNRAKVAAGLLAEPAN